MDFLSHHHQTFMAHAPFSLLLILTLFLLLSLPSFLEASTLSHDSLTMEEPLFESMTRRQLLGENGERETSVRNPTPSTTSASVTSASSSSSKDSFKKAKDFYGAAAHEVPSGPNPESN